MVKEYIIVFNYISSKKLLANTCFISALSMTYDLRLGHNLFPSSFSGEEQSGRSVAIYLFLSDLFYTYVILACMIVIWWNPCLYTKWRTLYWNSCSWRPGVLYKILISGLSAIQNKSVLGTSLNLYLNSFVLVSSSSSSSRLVSIFHSRDV